MSNDGIGSLVVIGTDKRKARQIEAENSISWVRVILSVLIWVLVLVGVVALLLGRWIVRRFGYIGFDQALMNLDGAGAGAGGNFVWEAVLEVAVVSLFVVGALGFVYFLGMQRLKTKKERSRKARFYPVFPAVLAVFAIVTGGWSLGAAVGLPQYLRSLDGSLNVGNYYVEPEIIPNRGSSNANNLVLIYLESTENTLGDETLFGTNMLASLQEETQSWEQISELHQYPGGGWTMAGIISTQCGIPLRMPPSRGKRGTDTLQHSGDMNRISTASYLSGATCLGDVLAANGYHNVYLGGAYGSYASKEQYYREHGYQDFFGREYWETQGETEFAPDWGLSDRRLFENAREVITGLEEADEPFALTLLTLDSHEPAPRFDSCPTESGYPLLNAIKCSMGSVAGFLHFMKVEGYLDNTTVVIMGDHLKFVATEESLGADFSNYPNRTIFNRIHMPDRKINASANINQFDMYPTVLEAMGFDLKDGRAGLGTSVFADEAASSSLAALDERDQEALIRSRSTKFYEQMWLE